jgi:endonuclease/exonuclease/phosphatase family metal-dependent hydrolase
MLGNGGVCLSQMWRIVFLLLVLATGARSESIRVATWNLQWFPSGSTKPVSAEQEDANVRHAASVIGIANPDVLLLQEIRDWETCQRLVAALAPAKYEVLICSAFRDEFSGGMGRQQVAILAKQSAQAAWSESWKTTGPIDPPRGFAFSVLRFGTAEVGFYSIHLKSNLVLSGGETAVQANIRKREVSVEQLLAHQASLAAPFPRLSAWIIAGDFNTNPDQEMFANEKTLGVLQTAGFFNSFSSLPLAARVTHPGKGRYPDATFDYVMVKGLRTIGLPEILKTSASDHHLVVVELELP